MSILSRVREDIEVVFDKDPAAKTAWEVICCYPGLHAVWLHHLAHGLWKRGFLLLGRLVSQFNRWLTGIEIHPGARIGRRFFIDHGMGVVIGETAEIGDDVLLYQGVVLGGTTLQKVKRHPTIGNNVVIGSGSIVLGAIRVGDNARVGAGSVVIRSVPAGATVVGVPARLVGQPEPGHAEVDLEHGRLPDPVVKAISEAFDRQTRLEDRVRMLEKRLAQAVRQPEPQVPQRRLEPPELAARVSEALKEVIDPEVGVSLVELGFVHSVAVDAHQAQIRLAIPEPECPFMDYFVDQIRHKVKGINGIEQVEVTFLDEAQASVRPPEIAFAKGKVSDE